ncbi:Membrane-associated tyrosine- and threonine-specific cdc2-inhibitory like protein [Verticillium longisporum]|nr:Membrane-associated tyrosine- and threonine-specific cdc2-inhibitory like protein [Verticillium longisporum]
MNGGRSVNKFAIGSYGVDLHFRLFFDPGTDRMVIFNLATKQMTARSQYHDDQKHVIRTPSYDIQLGASDPSAMQISRAAEMWLKEYKNHSKLSQQTTVVRIHEAYARFLSLYMEHSEADALRVMVDMATALLYIHEQGIVHNDVKPANILYSPTRGAVLIDFGLLSELSDKTRIYNGGSPWYVPPDYLTTGERGPSGDVFALGVVMLFLLRRLAAEEEKRPVKL